MKNTILCSPKLPKEILSELTKLSGYEVATIPKHPSLPEPVRDHPDMIFFNTPSRSDTVLTECYYAANPEFFGKFNNAKLIIDETELKNKYPYDIALDALPMGDTLYCLEKHTSETVKGFFKKIVNVRQGYAACSTLKLNDKAAVTADPSIAEALRNDGIRVLQISPDGIKLDGYGCGFIGGASAVIRDQAIFFGDLSNHPSEKEIREFCRAEGFTVTFFPHIPLTDHGSIRIMYGYL